ncbi:VWA domain-containing protein, partial [Pontibacter sp. BAB1700]|uniref:VWA domain-containing protein n=1 Tax=Pontibacter sp. BAB1700 TaxID=1144253 RepID=UPI00026BD664
MNKKKVYNLIVLDESGSMESIKQSTISGFNEVVQTIKGAKDNHPEQEHFISLVTFNSDGIKTKLYNVPVSELEEINSKLYQPNAMTPLFDAIGISTTRLHNDLSEETDTHVLVTILTDGLENASKEYTAAQIKQMIDKLQSKGWTFTYIGANH